ncbi:MAG: TonB-dependent receptor [Burkholderiaceae bacterium]|nr:TonB-dependent receptor [Burkholderiaceae bacterium]
MAEGGSGPDLTSLSLEQLGNVHVTSVSRYDERLTDAPASVYVISGEEIRRANVHSLPEALRLAPNLQVAQINAYQYAITARGFNSSTANKLLVLIDGRTIYTPLYSGVFWDAQDVLLQDIDRIEVVSGPGGTLWGANAVNGVINIVTKKASESSGTFVSATDGQVQQEVALRHGGSTGASGGAYRAYVKFDDWNHSTTADGNAALDGWHRAQAGFRADWHPANVEMTVQGDIYGDQIDQTQAMLQRNSGANLLVRWECLLPSDSIVQLQTYYDHTSRNYPGLFSEKLDILDVAAQVIEASNTSGQTVWGGGYRTADDRVGSSAFLAVLPAHMQLQWGNVFAQRVWTLTPDFQITTGARFEYNSYTHIEFLPSLRLTWKPTQDELLWTGLSRAVRAPSRIDTDFYFPGHPPYQLAGGPGFRSEIADTLDVGWRTQAGNDLSYSLTAFHSLYQHLESIEPSGNSTYVVGNQNSGRTNGLEAWATYEATVNWTVSAGLLLQTETFSGPYLSASSLGNDPHSQLSLKSHWTIGNGKSLDMFLRHVGQLPSPATPAYTTLDLSARWRLSQDVELTISGRNLLGSPHEEFTQATAGSSIVLQRAIDVTLKASF